MKQLRFLDWKVYQDSQNFFLDILRVVHRLPKEYRYEIGSQLNRAVLSVVLNIAEGSGKQSDKETNRFFEMALGSLYESVALPDTLAKMEILQENEREIFFQKMTEIGSQIGGFKKHLKKN